VQVFWGEPQPPVPDTDPTDEVLVGTARTPMPMYVATAGLVATSLAIAAFAGPLAGMTGRAGVDLLDREPYRVAVLGPQEGR
jgi:multicomponent Na+:H+ antiporter subunit D